jgi:tetratricopeptide (TPR) repeat protein
MTKAARKGVILVLVLMVLAATAVAAVGCSSSQDEATTTTAAVSSDTTQAGSSTTGTSDSDAPERLVVGGKSAEEYEAALPDLEKAVQAAPDDLEALQKLAIAQYNTARYEQAAATYQKMLQLKDDAFTRNNYGNVLRDWKKLDEAKAEYEKAISMDSTLATAYVNLASVLASEGDVAAALEVLDRGLQTITGEDKTRLESFKEKLTAATASTTTT